MAPRANSSRPAASRMSANLHGAAARGAPPSEGALAQDVIDAGVLLGLAILSLCVAVLSLVLAVVLAVVMGPAKSCTTVRAEAHIRARSRGRAQAPRAGAIRCIFPIPDPRPGLLHAGSFHLSRRSTT